MIGRRAFLGGAVGAAALTGTAALAGCAPARSDGTVRYWGQSGDLGDIEDRIISAFGKTEQGRGATVAKSSVPVSGEGDATAVITAVRGGSAPDVWFMGRFSSAQYASLGLLEPIDDMIAEYGDDVDEIKSRYLGFANAELMYDGKLYGLPMDTDTRALYYNVDMVREAGIDLDELDPANGPLTIDRVTEMSDRMIKKDGRGDYTQLGLIPWDGEGWGYTWALGEGATFFDDSSCSVTMDDERTIAAYEYLYDTARRLGFAKVDAFKATYEPPNHPPAQTSFFSGRQGFMLSGQFLQTSMRKYVPDLKFGVTYLPVPKAGDDPYTWSGGFSLVCPKGSTMSREVWEFMKYYTSIKGQEIYMPAAYALPTSVEMLEKTTNPVFTEDLPFFTGLLDYSTYRPPIPVGQLWWDAMFQAQSSVTIGSRTARGALEAAQARVEPQMALNCPFRIPKPS